MVCGMPGIKEVLPRFIDFIGHSILMGHNVQFDLNFLNSECEKNGLPYVRNHALATLRISRWAYPKAERHKLDYLADALKINKGHSHRAFDDAVTCKELFLRILKKQLSLFFQLVVIKSVNVLDLIWKDSRKKILFSTKSI